MTAQDTIQRLVRERAVGRKIDIVGFVDQLLLLANAVGEIQCVPVDDDRLRFTIPAVPSFEIALDHGKGKSRMMCARLAVLCQENGHEFQPYGGEGTISQKAKAFALGAAVVAAASNGCASAGLPGVDSEQTSLTWHARWMNVPGNVEFTLTVAR